MGSVMKKQENTSISFRPGTLPKYRKWAKAQGLTLSGAIRALLDHAIQHNLKVTVKTTEKVEGGKA